MDLAQNPLFVIFIALPIALGLIFLFINIWEKNVDKGDFVGNKGFLYNLFFGLGLFSIVIFCFWLMTLLP